MTFAAFTNEENKGCGNKGLDLNTDETEPYEPRMIF